MKTILRAAVVLSLASNAQAGLLDDVTKETNNSQEYCKHPADPR